MISKGKVTVFSFDELITRINGISSERNLAQRRVTVTAKLTKEINIDVWLEKKRDTDLFEGKSRFSLIGICCVQNRKDMAD